MQERDGSTHLKYLLEFDSIESIIQSVKTYGQYLTWEILLGFYINLTEEVKSILVILPQVFLRKVYIKDKNRAI